MRLIDSKSFIFLIIERSLFYGVLKNCRNSRLIIFGSYKSKCRARWILLHPKKHNIPIITSNCFKMIDFSVVSHYSSFSFAYHLPNPSQRGVKQHGASSENSHTEPVSRWRWFSRVRASSTFPAAHTQVVTEIFLPWTVVRGTRHPELIWTDQESLAITDDKLKPLAFKIPPYCASDNMEAIKSTVAATA